MHPELAEFLKEKSARSGREKLVAFDISFALTASLCSL